MNSLDVANPGRSPRFFIQKIEQNAPEKKIPSTAAKAISLSANESDSIQLSKHFQVDGKYKKLAEQDLGCTAEELPEWSKTRLEPQSQCAFCPWSEKIKLPHKSVTKKIKVLQV